MTWHCGATSASSPLLLFFMTPESRQQDEQKEDHDYGHRNDDRY
jgi:hypothetical protein